MSAYIRKQYGVLKSFLLGITLALMALCSVAYALTPMSNQEMAKTSGAGLAFAFDDFRFQMEPTSFFENIGGVPNRVAGATNAYKGNYLWIGTSITRGYPTTSGNIDYTKLYNYTDYIDSSTGKFIMNPTSSASAASAIEYTDMYAGTQTLSYPIAKGGAQGYAEINNPFVIRVHSYKAVGLNSARTDWVADVPHTVLELVGPTHSTPFRWAFWGEVQAFKDDGTTPLVAAAGLPAGVTSSPFSTLENQEIIIGSPTSRFRPDGTDPAGDGTGVELGCTGTGTGITGCGNGSYQITGPVFRMYQSMGEGVNDQTLGMLYHHRLSGDYRFSVNETGSKTAEGGKRIPTFDAQEGMYFMHVNAYLPMGQLHYQSLVISGVQSSPGVYTGDFITELTQVPNDPNVYNDFYGFPNNGTNTAPPAVANLGYNRHPHNGYMHDRYYETHGYVRWGNNFPTNAEFAAQVGGNAGSISNQLVGNGVGGTAGYITDQPGGGVVSGNSIDVDYTLDPMAVNATNITNVYHSGLSTVDIGLCQGGRDLHCGHDDSASPASDMFGTMQQFSSTVTVGVTTGTPAGQVTDAGDLLSAGGMVFLARDGGSWTLPQNPNLATTTASAMTNLLIANDWEVKEARTRTFSYQYDCGGFFNPCNTGWKLTNATTPNAVKIDGRAVDIINANGGASAKLRINGINLGSSRVEGMLIHHLEVTTLGAAN